MWWPGGTTNNLLQPATTMPASNPAYSSPSYTIPPSPGTASPPLRQPPFRSLWKRGVEVFENQNDFWKPFEGNSPMALIQTETETFLKVRAKP